MQTYSRLRLNKIVNRFRETWKKSEKKKGDQTSYLFYENFSRENTMFLGLGKMILAKGIQNQKNCQVVAIVNKNDKGYFKLSQSLGIQVEVFKEQIDVKIQILAKIKTCLFFLFKNNGKKLLKLTYKKILIGDLVYNSIIRANTRSNYTIERLIGKKEFEILEKAYTYAIAYHTIFKKTPPSYYIVDENGYTDAVIARVAASYKAQIIQYMSYHLCPQVKQFGKGYQFGFHSMWADAINQLLEEKIDVDYEKEAEKYLSNIFKAKGNVTIVEKAAYENKKVLDKQQLLAELGAENNKKNVLILAHCFSDCPLCGGEFIYQDYYEWFIETMKIIRNLKNVNWIIRPHPMRNTYHENGVLEKLYQDYKTENMFWMGDEYSSEMVPIVADAIITVNGTAGFEYSCIGIPSIVVGQPFYSGYGYTLNIKSCKHYKEVLEKVHLIHRLNETQIKTAKKILYLFKEKVFHVSSDEFQIMSNKATTNYFSTSNATIANNEYMKEVEEWLSHNDIRDSYLYQYGKLL